MGVLLVKVIIDFDNTFFTRNRDVDDGLALLYLLGSPEVEIVGITSTFGNSSIETVDHDTRKLMATLGLDSQLYAKGAAWAGDYLTDASHFIADTVKRYADDVSILAVGSMSNLQGAYLLNPELFQQVKQIVLMGGITAPLLFAKQEMRELNFSVDPLATFTVLTKGQNVSVLTGNNCLDLIFTRAQYEEMFAGHDSQVAKLIRAYSDSWFTDNDLEYGIKGFYNWDTLAAGYLVNPEYFSDQVADFNVSINSLSTGSLLATDFDPTTYAATRPNRRVKLNTPVVQAKEQLKEKIYHTWLKAEIN